jgi:hypothetical protein
MSKSAAASILAGLCAVGAIAAAAQERPCLHGASETPEQLARRRAAVNYARQVNTAEAALRRQSGSFGQLGALANVVGVPDGFQVQLSTDGATYTFSVKDGTDACQFAFFSDQAGLIFAATPIQ